MGLAGFGKDGDGRARKAASALARLYAFDGDGAIITADASPENLCWLRARHPGLGIRVAAAETVRAAILRDHGEYLKGEAVDGLERRLPELSARRVLSRPQKSALALLAVALAAGLLLWPQPLLRALVLALSAAFVASGLFRALLAWAGSSGAAKPAPLPRHGLPHYTILVPLYREAVMLPGLVQALAALDYPRALLDIKLVLEEDDAETIAAAQAVKGDFEIICVPNHGPRTKPKAANYALPFARGEYLVIYDAEDRPEPDQLLKAVAAFRAKPRLLACVQARLNFYNADYCWLTSGLMAQTPLATR